MNDTQQLVWQHVREYSFCVLLRRSLTGLVSM